MSFFPPPPDLPADTRDPDRPTQPRWMQPPTDEIPARVPYGLLLARTPDVAFVLAEIEVYSDGCYFRLDWTLRRGDRTDLEWQAAQAAFHDSRGIHAHSESALRFGVQLADGERLTSPQGRALQLNQPASEAGRSFIFHRRSGSGGDDTSVHKGGLWLWPLPPAGDLLLVLEWEHFGIPETDYVVDATRLLAAAQTVQPLWE
jgi:hypothetical protein